MPGKFNTFQRVMLQWNELHPYNAVNVVCISGKLDLARLQSVIDRTLQNWGLTNLTLNDNGNFHYTGGSVRSEIKPIPAGEQNLAAEIERQINTPFEIAENFNPFRFFVAEEQGSFLVGLVYLHVIADDGAAMVLFKEMIDVYLKDGDAVSSERAEIYPPRFDRLLRHNPLLLARKLAAIPELVGNLKNSARLHCRNSRDMENGYDFLSLPPETLKSLLKTAKSWNIKLNDLLLAILFKCLLPHVSATQARRRKKMSLGCVANLRNEIGILNPRTFGVFLGSFNINHEISEEISLKNLAGEIHRQTSAIKKKKLFLGTPLDLRFARLIFPHLSNVRREKFFRQSFPLCGGITNMNLNSLWENTADQKPLDYFRAVSTGPIVPLVLSVTTFNDVVNCSFTFRKSIFTDEQIKNIKSCFLKLTG